MSNFFGNSFGNSLGSQFGNWAGGSSPTPVDIFGANLVHEWDAALSTITIATGVSSISDLRGGKNLTEAAGGNQPTRVAADLQSYLLGNGTTHRLQNATMSLSGDITLLCVAQLLSGALTSNFLNIASAGIYAGGGVFNGFVTDSTGADIIAGGASNFNLHAFAVRNATAVARKSYVDGGAGVAGVRTAAMVSGTTASLFSNAAGGSVANARIYWAGVVAASPSLANLNAWGAWANARFGTTWSTAT